MRGSGLQGAEVQARQRFACPACRGGLAWGKKEARCGCGAVYPLRSDVLHVPSPLTETNETQAEFFSQLWPEQKHLLDLIDRTKLALHPELLEGAILDVGAGNARLARHFPRLDIISTDLVIDGIADLGARAAVCPLGRLPFKPESFDLVIAFEILEHIPQDQLSAAVARTSGAPARWPRLDLGPGLADRIQRAAHSRLDVPLLAAADEP